MSKTLATHQSKSCRKVAHRCCGNHTAVATGIWVLSILSSIYSEYRFDKFMELSRVVSVWNVISTLRGVGGAGAHADEARWWFIRRILWVSLVVECAGPVERAVQPLPSATR
jgi:hypothetical protein